MKKLAWRFCGIDAEGDWAGSDISLDGNELNLKKNCGSDRKQKQLYLATHNCEPLEREFEEL
jgi:hypothetical protein